MTIHLEASGRTDVGRSRNRNEDALHVSDSGRLLVVADGMGGAPGGDRASRIVVDTVTELLDGGGQDRRGEAEEETWEERWGRRMAEAVAEADGAVRREARRDPSLQGMGTTLTALLIAASADRGVVGHVGDSRAYRLPAGGGLTPVTTDHTWVQEQVEKGRIAPLDARHHPMGHVLSRVLGTGDGVSADVIPVPVEPDDVYLLCSDGLVAMLSDAEIEEILRDRSRSTEELADALVEEANRRGGVDNVTVAIARIGR